MHFSYGNAAMFGHPFVAQNAGGILCVIGRRVDKFIFAVLQFLVSLGKHSGWHLSCSLLHREQCDVGDLHSESLRRHCTAIFTKYPPHLLLLTGPSSAFTRDAESEGGQRPLSWIE